MKHPFLYIVATVLAASGCKDEDRTPSGLVPVAVASPPAPQAGPEPAPPAAGDDVVTVVFEPRQQALLSSQIEARIREIPRELGQPFREGEPLVLLDDRVYQANQKRAQAKVELARAVLKSKERLFKDGSISEADVVTARTELTVTEADLAVADVNLSACTIVAPFSGRVSTVKAKAHEAIRPGGELIEVVGDRVLLGHFLVPSSMLSKVTLGHPVKVRIFETGATVEGAISHIGGVIDPASSTLRLSVQVDNAGGSLRGGMRGELRLSDLVPGSDR